MAAGVRRAVSQLQVSVVCHVWDKIPLVQSQHIFWLFAFLGADCAGVGWGLQVGADLTEVVMVLNSDEAVKAFSRGGNVTIGGSVSAAAGPIGTGGQVAASLVNPSPVFSYSRSKGQWTLWILGLVPDRVNVF